MPKQKLYCYADETGQDTEGKVFLVSTIVLEKDVKKELKEKLLSIEKNSSKWKRKWRSTRIENRISYLKGITALEALQHNVFYSIYQDTTEYIYFTAKTTAKAISHKAKEPYEATILIHALNKKERQRVRKILQENEIKYRKIRGLSANNSPLIRLADALAGFFRDCEENQQYTKKLRADLVRVKIIGRLK